MNAELEGNGSDFLGGSRVSARFGAGSLPSAPLTEQPSSWLHLNRGAHCGKRCIIRGMWVKLMFDEPPDKSTNGE
jgi:hypothetical protein